MQPLLSLLNHENTMNTSNILIVGLCACTFLSCKDAEPPAPILPVPTPEQVAWQKNGKLCFCTFRTEYVQ